ncbi:TonB-dependent hemoglobin/transferrin/lactoferrin family receptor [Aliikangiella coralliicola]|uniref:TonB-dependent hemoglobin/transferrin/lactoferrin family receptor n=1 Tax=Aliikangiella coralliicola TaxID=2592383 RepID=A0A545UAB6_9GAMM|nr:TonB-dependent hemoglobin/transferrin/lactoferrin family receptor [Aliikangiella coralliicola]TQV86353.1 TonB-dependent hemoglobin/transferrin/lactoferrin family receptor [Aliikangiella coralliicola]
MKNNNKPLILGGLASLIAVSSGVSADTVSYDDESSENTMLITATRLPREVEDVAGTVTQIDSEELEKQLAEDLDDVVRYQPGLSMRTRSRGGNQGFTIRGMDGKRVLMLLDGVKSSDVFSAGPSGYGNDNYELDDLKSIEIIRGPASALYGADALGGVVLLRSKDPMDYVTNDDEVYLRLNASAADANDLTKLGFTVAGQADKWGYMLQVTQRDFAESEVKGEGFLTPQDGESTGGIFKVVYQPSDSQKWTFAVDNFVEEIEFDLTAVDTPELPSTGLDDNERTRFSIGHDWNGNAAIADRIESRVFWQTADGLQNTRQLRANSFSFDYAPFGNNTPTQRVTDFEFNQDVSGFSTTLFKTIESESATHSLVYGLSYEVVETERPRNRCETDSVTGATTCSIRAFPMAAPEVFPNRTFPDTETTRTGVFIQDEIVFGNSGFTLIPGIRYDQFEMDADTQGLQDIVDLGFEIQSTDESEVSKNLGLIYDVSESSAWFFQYAEGFRAPSYDEANQAFVNLGFGYATVPNPNLRPETSEGYEIGFKSRMGSNYVAVSVYDNHFEDFISSQFIGQQNGINLFQDTNIGEVRIYGAEFTGVWTLNDNWRMRNSIAYSKGRDEEADTYLNQVDPLTAVVGAAYQSDSDRWGFETIVTLVDRKDKVADENDVTGKSYGLLDMVAHFDVTQDLRLRLGGFNLLDKRYARWANIQGLDQDSASIANAQEPGREFRFGLTWTF